jgi:hypothetical protein
MGISAVVTIGALTLLELEANLRRSINRADSVTIEWAAFSEISAFTTFVGVRVTAAGTTVAHATLEGEARAWTRAVVVTVETWSVTTGFIVGVSAVSSTGAITLLEGIADLRTTSFTVEIPWRRDGRWVDNVSVTAFITTGAFTCLRKITIVGK